MFTDGKTAAMDIGQLPRGRHGLSRDDVRRSQRERILHAMAEAVSELGYAKTPVAEVLRRAGVSRETFYEQFANKERCFLASYDGAASTLIAEMDRAFSSLPADTGVDERLESVLTSYLNTLAAEPAIARTFLVDVYAAGPAALARRAEVQARFVDVVARLAGAAGERQRFACEALVAAVSAMVTQRICAGQVTEVAELRAPLLDLSRILLAAAGMSEPVT